MYGNMKRAGIELGNMGRMRRLGSTNTKAMQGIEWGMSACYTNKISTQKIESTRIRQEM
jgi:hypothetical protein